MSTNGNEKLRRFKANTLNKVKSSNVLNIYSIFEAIFEELKQFCSNLAFLLAWFCFPVEKFSWMLFVVLQTMVEKLLSAQWVNFIFVFMCICWQALLLAFYLYRPQSMVCSVLQLRVSLGTHEFIALSSSGLLLTKTILIETLV